MRAELETSGATVDTTEDDAKGAERMLARH